MRISLEWLSDFVDVPDVTTLVEGLTRAGIEVEAVHDPASAVTGVVVGLVESVEPHPKAEKVRITYVTDGESKHRVVCGAANVAAGQKVAFAKIGAKLPGFDITRRTIRGVDSEGMLCGKSELGLEAKSDGIWVLHESAELGQPLWSQVSSGATIELSVTANRPDLLSHYGVAREVAAFSGKRMKIPVWRVTEKGAASAQAVRVIVDDHKGCRRFVARTLSNVKVAPSPDWLRERLEAVGQRLINNVVDATNYVLLELGQPLHAYDLANIAGDSGLPTLHARRALNGEVLETLDGVERKLHADDIVIADAVRPLGLAGVMGGTFSEVTATTVNVVLEGAWFEPISVRRTAKRHGMQTEASRRFERGADLGITVRAVDRCAQLLTEMGAADAGKGVVEVAVKNEPAREINLRTERVTRLLGIELEAEDVVKLLEPLEIRCSARNESSLRFTAPTFRPDLAIEVDIIEEIARRHGYDNFPERVPDAGGAFHLEARPELASDKARRALLPAGLTEVVTYGFAAPSRFTAHVERAGIHAIDFL
ncbi:MAG: phenylalanine--tRNA ligase subunit beta, partial [Clostridia bacterium]|nr:phenylalanine--tRNA ligase subunit beta [Deltaproteobacteria bacterium]